MHAGLLFHFIYIFSTHLSFSPVLVFCYRLPDHPFLSPLLQPPSLRSLTHSPIATSPDQGSEKPLQTTVVLMNSNSKTSQGSGGGISVTTLCQDTPPAFKPSKGRGRLSFRTEWLSLLRPSTVNGTLKFSHSLNDVGQRMDSLCSGLHFIDRTCSEGELDVKPKQPNTDQKSKMFNSKAATLPHQASNHPPFPTHTLTRTHTHLVPSFTNNYKYLTHEHCLQPHSSDVPPPPPPPPDSHLHPPSSKLLRLFLPFSRSSTSASLQCSELGSYASRLHVTKSSSTLMGGNEPPLGGTEGLLGDDDVFEIPQGRTGTWTGAGAPGSARSGDLGLLGAAPLCYMDEDSDLDRFSILDQCSSPAHSDKMGPLTPGPLSPSSLSGDCCRWVIPGL
ncbi:uncharacterized protein [Salmo salar]|uniref:Uncharacterized protein n=1 Tax=Salmo salar TaxID=8030 RepID=A0ABM3F543_SALSA|nr:uncharacterized protein LOC123743815 [Salmo salar]